MNTISLAKNLEIWPIDKLQPFERNARTHSVEQIEKIASSIVRFGFNNPILVDAKDGIIAGHGRLSAAKKLGLEEVPVVVLTHLSDTERRAYILADNKLAELAGWDRDLLAGEAEFLKENDIDLSTLGFSDEELERGLAMLPDEPFADDIQSSANGIQDAPSTQDAPPDQEPPEEKRKLTDTFIVPPFSVLDARQGYWQERKRAWLSLGIKSEVGRGENLLGMSDTMLQPDPEKRALAKKANSYGVGEWLANKAPEVVEKIGGLMNQDRASGTSIFDPVLCELAYRWFSPKDGIVLDPFAGGSVRGIVAAKLGRKYYGCDLRKEQVEANEKQAEELCSDLSANHYPKWICGDSRDIKKHYKKVKADLIFSCPPYADLEVYSDDPADLSTLEYDEFRAAYRHIIKASVDMLKDDRFACFVIGEVREKDKSGFYRNFVLDTVAAFEAAGARFYNEMILLTSAGTLALRAGRVFSASRKIGKTHQNVLVFCKGDPWKAVEACGEIEVSLPEGMAEPANENQPAAEATSYGEKVTSIGGEL